MKSFWKKNWKWIVPAILAFVVVALVIFMYHWGFRIVYDPSIITNWDAVSGCAAWVSVAMSFAAILFAIWVPIRISKRQDRIALFEKRYKCFQFFEKCMILCSDAENDATLDDLKRQCCIFAGEYMMDDLDPRTVLSKVDSFEYILHSMEFLFPGLEENDLQELYVSLERFFISVILEKKDLKKHTDSFIQTMKKFQKKYGRVIWHYLDIGDK